MNMDKVYYHLKKSEEELISQIQMSSCNPRVDDTDYKLAMARLYNALHNYTNQIERSILWI